MVEIELHRGWAQIPIRAQIQRRSAKKPKPPRAPAVMSRADDASRDPSFRDLPAPMFREMPSYTPAAVAAAAAAAAASSDRPPPPNMGPLPAPGSRRPSPQSSVSSPGPGAANTRNHAGISGCHVHRDGVAPQRTSESIRSVQSPKFITPVASQASVSPPFLSAITPVASQMSVDSAVGSRAQSPGASDTLVQRLSRQVERLDSQVKKKEHEKQDLKGLLRERDSQLERMGVEASQLRRMLSDSVDVEMLKELRSRVHMLEEDVRQRDTDVAERSEHINRLQRQLGATSATGGAMTFLNDLIGAKEKFTQEAQRAKDEAEKAVREAEKVRQHMEQVTRQNEDKEHTIRELEHARLELSGKAQQDGQDAEALRGKVKQLEDMQKAQLRSAMDQLVDAVHRNDHLATEVLSLLAAVLVQKYTD